MTHFIHRLWRLLRPHPLATLGALVCMALVAGSAAAIAWLAAPAAGLLLGTPDPASPMTMAMVGAAGLTVLLVRGLATWGRGWLVSRVQQSVALRLRTDALSRLVRLETGNLDQGAGQIASRISADVDRIEGMVTIGLAPVLSGTLVVGALLVLAFEQSTSLPLAMLFVLPLVAIATGSLSGPIRRRFRDVVATRGRLTAAIVETVSRLEILRVFHAQRWREAHLRAIAKELERDALRAYRTAILVGPLLGTLTALTLAGVILWAHGLLQSGEMSVGGFSTLLTVVVLIFRPIQALGRGIAQAAAAMGALDHYDEFMALPVAEEHSRDGSLGRGITLAGITVDIGGTAILSGVDLELEPDRSIALVGPNGAGKTSILRVLTGALPVTEGVISVDGEPDADRHRAQRMIAWVPQDPLLFTGPVAANVALAEEVDAERLDEALKLSGAARWATPEMVLEDAGQRLSRGERQMISLARALYSEAPFLLLDEPTASLDRDAAGAFLEALHGLTKSRSLVVITHRLEVSDMMDMTVEVRDGKVVGRRENRPSSLASNG